MHRLSALLATLVLSTAIAHAADDGLGPLSDALASIRTTQGVNQERDAGPELTPIKHLFREWVESRLAEVPQGGDTAAFATQWNAALTKAGLTCDDGNPESKRCADKTGQEPFQDDARGYLGGVELSTLDYGRYVLVKTDVGVRCGFDQSAYIYQLRGKAWQLLWQSEQDRYGDKDYRVQNFLSVEVSSAKVSFDQPAPAPLVMTLGFSPWCQSNWQAIYTRLWRASPSDPAPVPLLDQQDTLYMGDDPAVATGSITQSDMIVEYRGNSVDVGVRPHVLHYLVQDGDRILRIAPVALNPRDFVDEWLTRPWTESVQWIAPGANKSVLESWYRTEHKGTDYLLGEFDGDATRCRADPALWQIGFGASDANYKAGPFVHFLVRWMAPYRFTLVGIRKEKYSNCDEAVSMPDNLGTLFPLQGWRD